VVRAPVQYFPFATDRVRYVGEPVAVVVAETREQAKDAAEAVVPDIDALQAVTSAREAATPGAPQLYDDCPNNEAYFYQAGNKAAVDEAFARAAHVTEQHLVINRVTAKSARKSAISKPMAQRMPGLRGTSTRRICNSAASRAACNGPAPPNATSV